MAVFKKGQRVRLVRVRAPQLAHNIGCTGTFNRYETSPIFKYCDCVVNWDGEVGGFMEEADFLEPIQPEGYKVVTWAECPWQPKREELTT